MRQPGLKVTELVHQPGVNVWTIPTTAALGHTLLVNAAVLLLANAARNEETAEQ